MNPKEYEEFILRLYNAGKDNADAISEMHSFVAQPGSLQTILTSISSHQISRLTVLISLSCIPNVRISSPEEMSYLCAWFRELCFNDAENLLSDDFIALLVNLFLFIFHGDQKNGATLIHDLSNAGPSQQNLSIQISLRIIEKSEGRINHAGYLIQNAISPFMVKNSPIPLINSACLLLKQLLSPGVNYSGRNECQIIAIKLGIDAGFPQTIFSYLFNLQEAPDFVTIHLLELLNVFLTFNPASFLNEQVRRNFIIQTVSVFFDYIKKVKISDARIPAVSSIFISLKKASSVLLQEDRIKEDYEKQKQMQKVKKLNKKGENKKNLFVLYDGLFVNAAGFTLFILENNESLVHLEIILDFWRARETVDYSTSPESEKIETEKILGAILKKFFSNDVNLITEKVAEILTDKSSLLVQKMVGAAEFMIVPFSKRVCQFLVEELNLSNIVCAAFCIEFLAEACQKEGTMAVFDNILNCVFIVHQKIEPRKSILFELALIHFFRSFLKRFVVRYEEPLRQFFIRFLIDIQQTSASIEIIQEIVDILRSKIITDECLRLIAQDENIFDLITKSQIFSSPAENQPKKVTTTVFQTLFQICFSMPNPERIITIIDYISNRIQSQPFETVAYLMMSGCFHTSNIKYETLYITLTGRFFPLIIKRMEDMKNEKNINVEIQNTNSKIVINILHLFNSISQCFLEQSAKTNFENNYMTSFIIDYSNLILKVLNLAIDISENLNRNSVEYFKIVSMVSLIMSNLITNNFLNFGVLEFYKIHTFQDTSKRLFDILLMISFESFLQNPKLLDRYLTYMKSVILKYLNLFLSIDDIVIQHHLQVLIYIMNLDKEEYSDRAINIFTYFGESLLPFEINIFEEKSQNAINCILQTALSIIFKKNVIVSSLNKLIYTFFYRFPKIKNSILESFMAKVSLDIEKDKLFLIFKEIESSFFENDDNNALHIIKEALDKLVGFSISHNISMSI